MTGRRRDHDEAGQTTILIVGLAVVLLMTMAVVVDASAAFLRRQSLDSLADGAALAGADAGASGQDVYLNGVDPERLQLFTDSARAGVAAYLRDAHAYADFPGLSWSVRVDPATRTVQVAVHATLKLPFQVPGGPGRTVVGATGSAAVVPDQ